MAVELVVPSVGESVTEVEIGDWLKNPGDSVEEDEPVVVIETDKITVELPAPAAGTITETLKRKGERAAVGDVIGYMEPNGKPSPFGSSQRADGRRDSHAEREPARSASGRVAQARQGAASKEARSLNESAKPQEMPVAPGEGLKTVKPPSAPSIPKSLSPREEQVIPMTPIRRRIAERLVEAHRNAALLTTFNQVDMSAVITLRNRHE